MPRSRTEPRVNSRAYNPSETTMNEWKIPGLTEALAFLKRCATIFKMAGVVVLIALLLIPLSMVRSVLRERLGRRNDAMADITSSWGRDQKLVGPVLIVPY